MPIIGTIQSLELNDDGQLHLVETSPKGTYATTVLLGHIEHEPDVPFELVSQRNRLLDAWRYPHWTVADARAEVLDGYRRGVGL